jgi:hypothetical protein
VTGAEAGSEPADARHRPPRDEPSEKTLAMPTPGAVEKAMEANTAAYDLVVTL